MKLKTWLSWFVLAAGVFMYSGEVQASVGRLDYDIVKLKTKICTTKSREYSPTWDEESGTYMGCWHGAWEEDTELIHFVDAEGNYTIAYADEKKVYIDTISVSGTITHKLSISKRYPLLKDVICDRENNYYIVWGQSDEKGAGNCVTISVAKYNAQGTYLDSCDVRTSQDAPGSFETLCPSNYCDTVISNGVLTTIMGRSMYNAHQSNTTVSVDIETMKLLDQDTCYVSHSFASRVLGLSSGEVLYGNLGDAYPRGFTFSYEEENKRKKVTPFHFYGELGDNDTYSQLGDMVEFGGKAFYCATSTKSMKKNCGEQSQNLFIQGINFEFEGGTSRTGTCNGKKYTDTGIIWLTNYTNKDAKNPQIVKLNDSQAVVMWESYGAIDGDDEGYLDTYYMIISAEGEVIQGARSLNKQRLNTFEQPVLWNNAIYWVSCGYSNSYRFTSSKSAIVYRLSLEQDNTMVKKGSRILIGNIIYKVTEIGKGAFEKCTNLIRVDGGKNVKKIGDNAFANCKNLRWVNTDKKLTTIGKKAFYKCKKLQAVTLTTKKLKKVGKKAFSDVNKNSTFYVPTSKAVKYRNLLQKGGLKKSVRIRNN